MLVVEYFQGEGFKRVGFPDSPGLGGFWPGIERDGSQKTGYPLFNASRHPGP